MRAARLNSKVRNRRSFDVRIVGTIVLLIAVLALMLAGVIWTGLFLLSLLFLGLCWRYLATDPPERAVSDDQGGGAAKYPALPRRVVSRRLALLGGASGCAGASGALSSTELQGSAAFAIAVGTAAAGVMIGYLQIAADRDVARRDRR